MKYGNLKLENLTQEEKDKILEYIIDDCVDYAGDTYEKFARATIMTLHTAKLIEY